MRGIKRVMTERRRWIFRGGCAMHERHRTQRGFACRTACNRHACRVVQRNAPDGGELREEIVRMLPIDQRTSVTRFSSLKDFGVTRLANSRRIKTEHAVQ